MRTGWFLLAALVAGALAADGPAPGELVERVACADAPGMSYALYVPSSYDPGRRWPLLLAFDPSGSGAQPVRLYRAAAERLGYIVAGSNDSRNYTSWEAQLGAARAMWSDVAGRLAIDPARVYTTGFSGGARVAGEVALISGGIAGVLAHGGSFRDRESAAAAPSFVFASAAGAWDMNDQELREIHRRLEQAGATQRRFSFEGPHRWAPPEVCERMLEWVELQAMRSGRRPPDAAAIGRWHARDLAAAAALEREGESLGALEAYARIEADFAGLLDTAEAASARARLQDSRELRRDERARRKLTRDELDAQRRFVAKIKEMQGAQRDPVALQGDLQWWEREIGRLRREVETAAERERGWQARRLLGFVSVLCYERGVLAYQDERWQSAVLFNRIGAIVHPEEPFFRFNLARALARVERRGAALEALAAAIDLGWHDAAAARADPAFAALHEDPAFLRLLARLD